MQSLSQYEVMAKLLGQVFGGKKSKGAVKPNTKEELEAIINKMGK